MRSSGVIYLIKIYDLSGKISIYQDFFMNEIQNLTKLFTADFKAAIMNFGDIYEEFVPPYHSSLLEQ